MIDLEPECGTGEDVPLHLLGKLRAPSLGLGRWRNFREARMLQASGTVATARRIRQEFLYSCWGNGDSPSHRYSCVSQF